MKILLMEDDPVLGEIVTDYLQQYYSVDRVFGSDEAEERLDTTRYDLLILDINVPGRSGISFLASLRSFHNTTPAIIISAYEDTAHLKESFDAGAHDYIRKPFDLEELKLRIEKSRVLFGIESDTAIELSEEIVYYPGKLLVVEGQSRKTLRPKEAEMLNYFIAHPNRLISQEELVHNIWGYGTLPSDATLRSYIRRLRQVIGEEKIVTQRGLGYRYDGA